MQDGPIRQSEHVEDLQYDRKIEEREEREVRSTDPEQRHREVQALWFNALHRHGHRTRHHLASLRDEVADAIRVGKRTNIGLFVIATLLCVIIYQLNGGKI